MLLEAELRGASSETGPSMTGFLIPAQRQDIFTELQQSNLSERKGGGFRHLQNEILKRRKRSIILVQYLYL